MSYAHTFFNNKQFMSIIVSENNLYDQLRHLCIIFAWYKNENEKKEKMIIATHERTPCRGPPAAAFCVSQQLWGITLM
jgi:hypothetical protein